jgi:hypothetical protein
MNPQPLPRQPAIPPDPASNDHERDHLEEELASLRADFPDHRIDAESVVDRVRYVACARQYGVRPHTVITPDLGELRAALESGQPGMQQTVSR